MGPEMRTHVAMQVRCEVDCDVVTEAELKLGTLTILGH